MARYSGSVCRLCRRENQKLFLKGDRCTTDKCAVERRAYPPGQHGQGRIKFSEYGLQLREKQKIKRIYGMLEKQFRNLFEKADSMKGITGSNLLSMLERRMDNVVFRAGFANSRAEARHLVRHGHFAVNSRKVNIPSYMVAKGDVVEVREKSKNLAKIAGALEAVKRREIPQWIELDPAAQKARVRDLPTRDDITAPMEERLVVELYSK
ncbi:MAG TPA: 30S ribosomal protein S4 [Bdellovibrionales bacterium]|nr:MAG: 30S ribosomal protein S4 [Bdellovibrionales bacterium GWB1_52_6]OFZ02619.1 MAG: 30S ribosomal protein S4 [Bdellovibrionales bacterium GWA1_52_35]OFZ43903.1 MAG: 30S ribosomal protein S4 [Bdellovibrionales bacterium GWC1_52_8]HAR41930.1 30S ribosomal protein S4 [Bdellovibrionales bacterium]HCM41480.1 30S ribosomal protein S4 [Bdellovibrionales bacterium]